jgi:hypothetical protein
MRWRALAAAATLTAVAGPAFSDTFNLGVLGDSQPLYHSFSNYVGNFTDIYTFTLAGPDGATVGGDTTTINFGTLWNVDLFSITLSGGGIASPLVDTNPNDGFSFSGIAGGGPYTLTLNGRVNGVGMNGTNGIYAGYVSAVPEPAALGLALAGLLLTGVALRRRA